jgi:hypothetical protein
VKMKNHSARPKSELKSGKLKPAMQPPEKPGTDAQEGLETSFYEKVLDAAEKLDFATAAEVDGIDDEIAILRVKIKAILANEPENIKLMMAATNLLAKLVKTRYSMNKRQEKSLGEAIHRIITEIGVPLGVSVINKKL